MTYRNKFQEKFFPTKKRILDQKR